jgi:hypothetical protein
MSCQAGSILAVFKTRQMAGAALVLHLSPEGLHCLHFFQGSQLLNHLSATGRSENNGPAWDVHDPHFLVLGMGDAFSRHANGQ